jgi:hypothetical protein
MKGDFLMWKDFEGKGISEEKRITEGELLKRG